MPAQCVAAGCNKSSSSEITLFRFPKDQELRKKWIAQVQRTRAQWKGPLATSVLCSAHFTEEDFEPGSLLYKSFGMKKSKKLKPGAVPSIFKRTLQTSSASPFTDSEPPQSKKRRTAYEKRERQKVSYV